MCNGEVRGVAKRRQTQTWKVPRFSGPRKGAGRRVNGAVMSSGIEWVLAQLGIRNVGCVIGQDRLKSRFGNGSAASLRPSQVEGVFSLSDPVTRFAGIDSISGTQVPEATVAKLGLLSLAGIGACQAWIVRRNSNWARFDLESGSGEGGGGFRPCRIPFPGFATFPMEGGGDCFGLPAQCGFLWGIPYRHDLRLRRILRGARESLEV